MSESSTVNAPEALLGWSSVNRLTGLGRWIAVAPAGRSALRERTDEWGPES
jgi:hypothetical protein